MKQRFLSFLLCLMLLLPCACAEEHMFSYIPQNGTEYHMLGDGGQFEVPEGLEALYQLFSYGDPMASVCVFRMPNGRALVSVSSMLLPQPLTTEELYGSKDAIAQGLSLSMGETLTALPDFRLENFCGQEAMVADLILLSDNNMPLNARTALFCRGSELIEIWTAHPGKLTYAFDPKAEKELKADLKTMEELVGSFRFETGEPISVPHVNIAAADGMFRISAPLDTIAINAATDADTVSRALARFAELQGGAECFALWYEDVMKNDSWLLLSPEYGLAAQISVATDESYQGLTLDDFAGLDTLILNQRLKGRYEQAQISAEAERIILDGLEHLWFTYDLDNAGMELLTYVFCTIDDGNAYELDIYLATNTGKGSEELSNAVLLLMDTIDYLPDIVE